MVLQNARVVPPDTFPAAYARNAARVLRPSRVARVIARLRAYELDRALIAGANPASSRPLAARTAGLTAGRHRRGLAEGLERLLRRAQAPRARWWASGSRDQVLANASAIVELAELLRDDAPLYARGIAIVEHLLSDGSGPAYDGSRESLARRLREARAGMLG